MRGTSHSVEGYPGWRPKKKLNFEPHHARSKSVFTSCLPFHHASPVSITDLGSPVKQTPRRRNGRSKGRRPSSSKASSRSSLRASRSCPRLGRSSQSEHRRSTKKETARFINTRESRKLLRQTQKALQEMGIAKDYCIQMNASGGASIVKWEDLPKLEQQKDNDFVSRMHELIFAGNASSPQQSLSRPIKSLSPSPPSAETQTLRLTYVNVKKRLITEFGRERFDKFQGEVQHLMCERERQHSRSVSINQDCAVLSAAKQAALSNKIELPEHDSQEHVPDFNEAHPQWRPRTTSVSSAVSKAPRDQLKSRLSCQQFKALQDNVSTIFDYYSGAELLYSSQLFGQKFAFTELHRHMNRVGIWCWALIVIDTEGQAFGCYSELPFAERQKTCGKRDFIFCLSKENGKADRTSDATGDVSFQQFEWNSLTSSQLQADNRELHISNQSGFQFVVHRQFKQGTLAAGQACTALDVQQKTFNIAAVEVWVPSNFS